MTKKPALSQPLLRARAEDRLRKTRDDVHRMPLETVQELIYELQVHQVELEMQNEELRNIQQELENSRDKYQDLYDFAPVAYLTMNKESVILGANLMAGSLLEIPRGELMGKTFTKFIKCEYQDIFYLHKQKIFDTDHQQTCELQVTGYDGATLFIQLHSLATGKENTFRTAISDITAMKSLQNELTRTRDEAHTANQAKSQFLANMSHEMRTPLSAIVGLGHILSKSSPLTPKQEDYLNTLRLSSDSLLALVNEMLDITRIEAGKIDLEHIPFELQQLLDDSVRLMSMKAREKGLMLTVDADITHPYYYGDPLRVRQILLNLIGNAIKFTEKGRVMLSVETKAHADNWRDIVIAVADTGIGIPKEKTATIFETFIQVDASNTRKYGGAGLGLAICKKLIEQMGGTIGVESKEGIGSTFTVHLPLKISTEVPYPESSSVDFLKSSAPLENLPLFSPDYKENEPRVLLVEDHHPNILIATTLLAEFNYNYDVARTGKEALQKLHERNYSLILLDIHMHDMDGFEVLRIIREKEAQKGLPRITIIAMTACAMQGDKEKCLQAGMDDYIPKPFQPDELRGKLEQYVAALAA